MAMTTCPECLSDVSSRARACPNCGCPIETSGQRWKVQQLVSGLVTLAGFTAVCVGVGLGRDGRSLAYGGAVVFAAGFVWTMVARAGAWMRQG